MGQEIEATRFSEDDFHAFARRLDQETALLGRQLEAGGRIAQTGGHVGGFELEAWLLDRHLRPAPVNQQLIERLDSPLVVPELARFNVELNGHPEPLAGRGLRRLHQALDGTWQLCRQGAEACGAILAMNGIWPTVTEADFGNHNMSDQNRYRALNEQLLRLRGGRDTELRIDGIERLDLVHAGVMLESAATSFQIHLQTDAVTGVRHYNAALLGSAALVATAANSPCLFGRELWAETRIPLFEQAVDVGDFGGPKRVVFGSSYLEQSLFELFERNRRDFPVMLPVVADEPPEAFTHVRLHNGTIWRWTRALIGFDERSRPQLRLEYRALPAGPTIVDCVANAAFVYGLAHGFASLPEAPELRLPFATARENFYRAAEHGLAARVTWFGGRQGTVAELIIARLLAVAREGLARLEVDRDAIDDYLEVIEARVRTGRTGADWQRRRLAVNGRDHEALAAVYLDRQRTARPVHEWER